MKIYNEEDFQQTLYNNPTVHRVVQMGGTPKDCVVALVKINEELTKQLHDLYSQRQLTYIIEENHNAHMSS